MRTLSARILLGFVALTIAFAVFVATIVVNLHEINDEASLILDGYVPILMASNDLAQYQRDLKNLLEQGIDDTKPVELKKSISSLRTKSDNALKTIGDKFSELPALVRSGPAATEVADMVSNTEPTSTASTIAQLQQALDDSAPLYNTLLAALPFRAPAKSDPGFQAYCDALDPPRKAACDALQRLRDSNEAIGRLVETLRDPWTKRMRLAKGWLAGNEQTITGGAIYLGIATVVLAVVITAWVAVMLRPLRRLREGARRIAAGDYGKRISETGPTEIADLAREFNAMGRAVQEREEEKLRAARLAMVGKMAAQIAHEVRNPLSSIGLNTELLEDELAENDSEARALCRAIHTEVNRLTEVTEIYLGLRGGKPKLARESLNTIIDDLVGFVRNDLATRRVALETELDPGDPTGYIDANQIRQCLINLVRNAADAVSAKGGGNVVLRTRAERARVEIAVEDNGIGIASELLPRLFDPFFSTKEGGNGLGLALTQQIIRDHGGEIRVDSRVGRGTTFTLSVPVA
jgi:signal transduction histidine kinase